MSCFSGCVTIYWLHLGSVKELVLLAGRMFEGGAVPVTSVAIDCIGMTQHRAPHPIQFVVRFVIAFVHCPVHPLFGDSHREGSMEVSRHM